MPDRSFADYQSLIYSEAGRAGPRGLIAVFMILLVHETLHEVLGWAVDRAAPPYEAQTVPAVEAGLAVVLILCAFVASRFVGRLCASWGEEKAVRSGRAGLRVEEDRFRAVAVAARTGTVCGFVAVLAAAEAALLFAVEMGAAIILVIPVGMGLPVLTVLAGVLVSEMRNGDMPEDMEAPEHRRLRPAAAVGGRRYGGK